MIVVRTFRSMVFYVELSEPAGNFQLLVVGKIAFIGRMQDLNPRCAAGRQVFIKLTGVTSSSEA